MGVPKRQLRSLKPKQLADFCRPGVTKLIGMPMGNVDTVSRRLFDAIGDGPAVRVDVVMIALGLARITLRLAFGLTGRHRRFAGCLPFGVTSGLSLCGAEQVVGIFD